MRRQITVIALVALFVAGAVGAGVSYAVAPKAHQKHTWNQRATKPVVHEVGAPGEPAYLSNFKGYDGPPFGNLSFYKDTSGVVHLTGLTCEIGPVNCESVTLVGGTKKVFILPKGFRPTAQEIYTTLSDGRGEYLHIRVDITKAGAVEIVTPPFAGMDWISFDGVSFLSK